jgi:glutamate racemase
MALPRDLDAVIYGCTHYPVLADHFTRALGANVLLVDPAIVQAERVATFLQLDEPAGARGRTTYVTTGDESRFFESVRAFLGTEELTPLAFELYGSA